YIERCLESIADQTYNDYEVILVHNDIEYISGLIKNNTLNIKTIEMKESDGISKYKNKAIEHATGEFLIFIDADDFLHPNALIYAKQMIEDNGLERNVFKFGISKTNLDKTSTLNTNKRAFFDNEALTKLEEIFKDVDIELNNQQVKSFVNGMFEKGIIGHKFTDYSPGNYFKKLNYQFRVHSYIIRKSFLIQNDIQFDNENLLYNDIPFLLELYNKTPYIIQSNTKLYYKFIHNDPINAPSLTQEEHEDRILQRVRALKEGLLKCIDPEIAKKVKIEAMRYYLYKVIKSDLFTDFSSEMYEIYQLLNEIFNYPSNEIKLSKRHSFEINAIKNGNLKKAFMLSKSRVLGYKTYQFMKPKNQRFRQKKVQKNVFTKLPIKENTILYESFLGRNYSD
ncbi:hypothetical protein BUZ00_14005, partial [Staphylococcus gallinarum]